jgi:hypothetical protein
LIRKNQRWSATVSRPAASIRAVDRLDSSNARYWMRTGVASIVGNDIDGLSEMVRPLMRALQRELAELDARIAAYARLIRKICRVNLSMD